MSRGSQPNSDTPLPCFAPLHHDCSTEKLENHRSWARYLEDGTRWYKAAQSGRMWQNGYTTRCLIKCLSIRHLVGKLRGFQTDLSTEMCCQLSSVRLTASVLQAQKELERVRPPSHPKDALLGRSLRIFWGPIALSGMNCIQPLSSSQWFPISVTRQLNLI